ncbi:glycosyltransferase, partial [Shewanella pealeana]
SMDAGGVSKVNAILANEFIRKNYKVEFLSFKKSSDSRFHVHSFNFKKYKVLELFVSFFKLMFFLSGNKYDLIISSSDLISLPVCLANSFYKNRLIVNSHTNVVEHLKSASTGKVLLYRFCGLAHRYATVVANVSSGAVLASQDFYKNINIIELHNPVEPLVERKISELKHEWFENNRVIVACGRLTKSKNYELMIDVMKLVATRLSDVRLIILGDGELYESLSFKVKELKLENYVCLLGKVNNPVDYMSSSEFLLHTSFYEGSPAVLLEAMSAGIPAVTTRFKSGAEEIIGNDVYGIISNSFKADDVFDSILKMLEREKLPKSFYQNSVKQYSPVACCNSYLNSVGLS